MPQNTEINEQQVEAKCNTNMNLNAILINTDNNHDCLHQKIEKLINNESEYFFMRPVHKGLAFNDTLPKLPHVRYITVNGTNSSYHNLRLKETLSYLTTFACWLGRFRYARLLFRAVPAGEMFQRKTDQILKVLPKVFDISDNILVAGYDNDGTHHYRML